MALTTEGKLLLVKFLVVIGFAFTTCALTLGIVTYVIAGWYTLTPSTSIPTNLVAWAQLTRNRGIFQECSAVTGLSVSPGAPFEKKNDCFDNDIGQYPTMYAANDSSYMMIIGMRQSQLVLHGISLVISLGILMIGLGIILRWCCTQVDSVYYIRWRLFIGLISILTFLLTASSASLGTGIMVAENNSVYFTQKLPLSQFNFAGSSYSFGTMYILAWVSSGFSLLAAIFFLITVCLGSTLEEEKYKPRVVAIDNPAFTGVYGKSPNSIYLSPSIGSSSDIGHRKMSSNTAASPGLLPRYNIET